MALALVALGSALGGVLRYVLSELIAARAGAGFPWGTLFVNVTGSFLIGFWGVRFGEGSPETRLFLTAGLCGGYTTFSGFSLQTLQLLKSGDYAGAGANAVLSAVLCVAAAWIGGAAGAWSSGRGA